MVQYNMIMRPWYSTVVIWGIVERLLTLIGSRSGVSAVECKRDDTSFVTLAHRRYDTWACLLESLLTTSWLQCMKAVPCYFHPAIGVQNVAVSVSLCLSVCRSVRWHTPETTHVHISPNFLYMLPMVVARSSCDVSALRFLFPVFRWRHVFT